MPIGSRIPNVKYDSSSKLPIILIYQKLVGRILDLDLCDAMICTTQRDENIRNPNVPTMVQGVISKERVLNSMVCMWFIC